MPLHNNNTAPHSRGDDGLSRITTRNASVRASIGVWSSSISILSSVPSGGLSRFCSVCFYISLFVKQGDGWQSALFALGGLDTFF
jgi:hypothetical protein